MSSIRGGADSRLLALQALRGIAALSVTIGHALGEAVHRAGADIPVWLLMLPWRAGVDVFFVISGTVIALSAARAAEEGGWRRFLRDRIVRVVPLYWTFTLLMLGVLLTLQSQVHTVTLDWAQVGGSFAFWPVASGTGEIIPILTPGWTLNYEMAFYLAVTVLIAAGLGRRGLLTAVLLLFGTAVIAGRFVPPEWTALWFWTRPVILEFAAGVLIGRLWLAGRVMPKPIVGLALAAPAFVLLVVTGDGEVPYEARAFVWGAPAAILVAAAVLFLPARLDGRTPRLLTALGDSSYALYLSHRFVLRALTIAWPGAAGFGFAVVAVVACVVAGHVVYLFYERPLLSWLRRRRRRAVAA